MTFETTFPVNKIRKDFPALQQEVNNKPLIYFDNAATTQKPWAVINAISHHYQFSNANVHRAVHTLSNRATQAFEAAREAVTSYIHAASTEEIIFTKGTTEGINLIAHSYGRTFLQEGDEILITTMEHHADIVPWQVVRDQTGCKLRVAPITASGEIDLATFFTLLSANTKIVAFPHISNVLGTINPVAELIQLVRQYAPEAVVVVDGAQAVAHEVVNVQKLDCDFYVFSGHKLYAPSGIGILYGKKSLLEKMPPFQTGGEMIRQVTFEKTVYNDLPYKFEAGTPNMEGAIGLHAAIDYIKSIGLENIREYEHKLLAYATAAIADVSGLQLIGTAAQKSAILTFVCEDAPAHDLSTLLDLAGIAVRVGHHCAMPLLASLNLTATVRASFAFYNTAEEVDIFIAALKKSLRILRG